MLGQATLETTLRSLDQNESAQATVVRPDRYRLLECAVSNAAFSIPRGSGLSYCLASAGDGSTSILMTQFDRVLDFDPRARTITVEAGMTIGDLLLFVSKHDLWFPVIPGYPSITVGGCLAMNVHGKSQYHDGLFADHVEEFTLLHPSRGAMDCSRTQNQEIFALTVGGFGLTGVVTKMVLHLQELVSHGLDRTRAPVKSLTHAVEVMLEHKDNCDQIYSWNDLNLKVGKFGCGFVYLESFAAGAKKKAFSVGNLRAENAHLPFPRLGLRAINHAYRAMEKLKPARQSFDLMEGAFPLNGKEIYFKACGSKGFNEFQMIIPMEEWPKFVGKLQSLIASHGVFTTLGSLKIFRGSPLFLNFRADGVCIAIDIPRQTGDAAFMAALDNLMLECVGIPNISKDSRLTSQVVASAFPGYEEYKSRLLDFDPEKRMQSALRARLDV